MTVRSIPRPTSWEQGSTLLPLFKDQLLVDCPDQTAIAERLADQLQQVSMGTLYTRRVPRTLVCMADFFWTISDLMYECEAVIREHSSPLSPQSAASLDPNPNSVRPRTISFRS
jgi:hypothetical protein